MAARANLVVNDRTTPTPVARTFTPDGDDTNGVHVHSEKGTYAVGNARFTSSLKYTKGRYRPVVKLAVPVVQVQTINGVSSPAVVMTNYAEIGFNFSDLSSPQQRADVVGMIANALATANTQYNDLLVNLSDIY